MAAPTDPARSSKRTRPKPSATTVAAPELAAPEQALAVPPPVPTFRAALLSYFRTDGSLTRAEVAERTEWSRVTVTTRIQHLLDDGLLIEEEEQRMTSGRPATSYAFNAARASIAVLSFGLTGAYIAWCDLQGTVQASATLQLSMDTSPQQMLEEARVELEALPGLDPATVWGLAIGVPAPVERESGRVVEPPMLRGWEDIDLKALTGSWFHCDVIVENDANALAYGEFVSTDPPVKDLLYLKIATGIGAGIIANGDLLRGARGAAGDLGHLRADNQLLDQPSRVCKCKRQNCIEAHASGWGIAQTLQEENGTAGLLRRLDGNDPTVRAALDTAGRIIGAGAAQAVSLLNPAHVVIGGQLALHEFSRRLVRNIQDEIEDRALGLATRDITVRASTLGDQAAAIGLATLFAQRILTRNDTLHMLLTRSAP